MQNTELAIRVLARALDDPDFSMGSWSTCLAGITLKEAGYEDNGMEHGFTAPDGQHVPYYLAGREASKLLGFTPQDTGRLSFLFEANDDQALGKFALLIEGSLT